MNEKNRPKIPAKTILYAVTALILIGVALSYVRSSATAPLRDAVSVVAGPIQRGFDKIGSAFYEEIENVRTLRAAQTENAALKEEIAALKEENTRLLLERTELDSLRELFDLRSQYSQYEMVGAHVIAKDSGRWFHSFTVDKGTKDGIKKDMNVIAQGGLVGIVTYAGPNYARVLSIIDDESNVMAMSTASQDGCIVSGDLKLYEEGLLRIMHVEKGDVILADDRIVTSNTSTKYLPGILVGIVREMSVDANNLTQSGTLVPVVDFRHLDSVLIITTLKEDTSGEDTP
ncbi:MAG: rod shape-determining protein MreC [Lachnospiraceae bacterium]|nr:rod shape-determining protein MreC [Lachnospiraceae bacterium]